MSETVILWILGAIITLQTLVIGALVSWVWQHTNDCRDFRTEISAHNATTVAKLDRVIQDIGDHDSGLRGQVHELASRISPYIIHEQMRRD